MDPAPAPRVPAEPAKPSIEPIQHDGSREELPPEREGIMAYAYLRDVLGFRDDEYTWLAQKEQRGNEAVLHTG